MRTIEVDTTDKRQVSQFLQLPFRLYRNTPQWVPPLAGDAALQLNRQKYPFYKHSDAAFFLALNEQAEAIGRIAAIENSRYNDYHKERTAFFYLFECENHPAAAQALFDAAFAWARGRGLNKILGPKSFSPLDGMGLLVKGFEHRPALNIPYNPPYYADFVEAAGLVGFDDEMSGYLDAQAVQFPERLLRGADLVSKRYGLTVTRFKTRNDLRPWVPRIHKLYNDSLAGTYGNVPITDDEAKVLSEQILWFADPRLIKFIMKGDRPVGFCLGYPDISAALQRTKGRLFPFGWADLLLDLRRTQWINLNGAGIIEEYRGKGGTALLFAELYRSIVENPRYRHADLVQISSVNDKMQREVKDLGVDFYKMHRMYQRML